MRYVSEQFLEKQNQLIRPPLKMYFEVATDVNQRWLIGGQQQETAFDDFDFTVAPVKSPSTCENEYYYAVVGDGVGVDDPNKMCAPVDNSGFATPNHSVPFGVMNVSAVNETMLIGDSDDYQNNFSGGNAPFVMSFKGSLIPETIEIQKYASGSWSTVKTINNSDLSEEIYVTLDSYVLSRYRFYITNSTKGGRYQFNYVRGDLASYPTKNYQHIVFENNRISSVSISEETDLTSQALPTYEMTVTCLDVNNEFSPESEHWNKEFSGGQPCFFKVGYESDGIVEYTPVLFGSLSKEPTYDNGKITFYVSIPMALSEGLYLGSSYVNGRTRTFQSQPNSNLNVGDEVDSVTFSSFLNALFDSSNDIFADSTDENNSLHNYYGIYPFAEARQLTANALGGYIRSGFGTIDLYNANNIQYKQPDDYLTRYEQVKATLESQAKVGSIEVVRNSNTVSADYADIECSVRTGAGSSYMVNPYFYVPFWAIGKVQLIDAQSSVAGVTVTMYYGSVTNPETMQDDGSVKVQIGFKASAATTIKPIVRFYRVDNTKYNETESAKTSGTETYTNDNELITNTYTANKAKRVAKFISDVSNQYEVDVVQDIRYELGDVIRLETEKNVFKTCVITGLKFNFPGSKGHVTCRKIFNIADSGSSLYDVNNSYLAKNSSNTPRIKVTGTENGNVVVGKLTYVGQPYFFILGATGLSDFTYSLTTVSDDNLHDWNCYSTNVQGLTYTCPVVDLGAYDSAKESDYKVYGIKTLLMKLYAEQNMTAPINYTNP